MDSLNTILLNKDFDLPPEVIFIKSYVQRHFKSDVGIKVSRNAIIIQTNSAALAGSLRMHLHKLKAGTNTDKQLILRIGKL